VRDRGPLGWLIAVLAALGIMIVVAALIGARDKSGETVTAGEWAQTVCGAVGAWRGELEAIVEDVRTPGASGDTGSEEPQSETPQGRTGFIRGGVEDAVQATETMVVGIENAGTPDTPQGEAAAQVVSDWASSTQDDLEAAQASLDEEADTLEESIDQLTAAARSLATGLTGGIQALVDVAQADPELTAALRDSSTCREVREDATG
jgi:hypothetical protein